MAQISISISSEYESSLEVGDYEPGNGVLSVLIRTNLPGDGKNRRNPYARDWLTIHGTDADLREFSRKIAATLEEARGKAWHGTVEREESEEFAHELAEQNDTGEMRCPPRE
jgi:hypothetical protein